MAGLAGDWGEQEIVRAGVGEGLVEGFGGGSLGFAGLAGGDEGEAGIGAVEELGLARVGGEAEVGGDPMGGGEIRVYFLAWLRCQSGLFALPRSLDPERKAWFFNSK